jgi:hypothetical protein
MSILKVYFGTVKIQKLRRIALAEGLLETLKMKEGDAVKIELDVSTATIEIRAANPQTPELSKRRSRRK